MVAWRGGVTTKTVTDSECLSGTVCFLGGTKISTDQMENVRKRIVKDDSTLCLYNWKVRAVIYQDEETAGGSSLEEGRVKF